MFTSFDLEKTPDFKDLSLISFETRDRWAVSGLLQLMKFFERKNLMQKQLSFKLLSDDVYLQRKAFIENTDRCIMLSEQLFQAKEAKEVI